MRAIQPLIFCILFSIVGGCEGPQSALHPAGKGAEKIADLFWWMTAGATCIWLVVIGLSIQAVRTHMEGSRRRQVSLLIIGGGSVIPTFLLSGLLLASLPMLPELLSPAPDDALRIQVRGKMWWWRIRYLVPNRKPIELANEIRLPVDEPVEFELASDDVIHSFWIPSLGGKVDMFPGRGTRLKLEPTKTGVFRGACAEYCGSSHALMNFTVVVMERTEFDLWLKQQSEAASTSSQRLVEQGQRLFLDTGCHACHTIRGTEAQGVLGPDLTHVGSRRTIAAGVLPNEPTQFVAWISHPNSVKPGAKMPGFWMLPAEDLQAIAAYLESLQ